MASGQGSFGHLFSSRKRCPACRKVAVYPEQKHCGDDGELLIAEAPAAQSILKSRSYAEESGIVKTAMTRSGDIKAILAHPEDFCPNCSGEKRGAVGGHGEALPGMEPGGTPANVFTLVAMSLGVGVFVLPVACTRVGIALGVGCVVGCGLLSDFVMQCIVRASLATGATTFEGLAYRSFGLFGPPLVSAALAASTFTVSEAAMTKLEYTYCLLAIGAFALPLCFGKSLSGLRFMATFSVLWVILTVCVVLVKAAQQLYHHGISPGLELVDAGFVDISRLATQVLFAFSSMMTMFPVLAETPNRRQVIRDTHIANAIVTVTYSAVVIMCGLAYGAASGETVLSKFDLSDHVFLVLKLGLVVCLTGLYPVINFPMVLALNTLIFPKRGYVSQTVRGIMSVLGFAAVIVIVVVIGRLDVVFGLCGGLGMGSCAYWLPAAVVLGLILRRHPPTHLMDEEDGDLVRRMDAVAGPAVDNVHDPVGLFSEKRLVSQVRGAVVTASPNESPVAPAAEAGSSGRNVNVGRSPGGRIVSEKPTKSLAYLQVGDISRPGMPSATSLDEPFPGSGPADPLALRTTRIYADGVELAAHHGERISFSNPVVYVALFTVTLGLYAAGFSCYDAVNSALATTPAANHTNVTFTTTLTPHSVVHSHHTPHPHPHHVTPTRTPAPSNAAVHLAGRLWTRRGVVPSAAGGVIGVDAATQAA